jgi:hypothetical protein
MKETDKDHRAHCGQQMRGIPIVPPAGIIIKTEKKVDTAKIITGTFTPVFTICIKTM